MPAFATVLEFIKTRAKPVSHIYSGGEALRCGIEFTTETMEISRQGYNPEEISCPNCRERISLPVVEDGRKRKSNQLSQVDDASEPESTQEDNGDDMPDMPS